MDSGIQPRPRHAHAMTYDAASSTVTVFGGMFDTRDATLPTAERERPLCDTWSLKDSTWTRAADTTCAIAATAAVTLIAPGTRDALTLVEGARASLLDTQPLPLRLFRRDTAGVDAFSRQRRSATSVERERRRRLRRGAVGARRAGARRARRRRVGMGWRALAARARRGWTTAAAAELRDRVRLATPTRRAHRRSGIGAATSARRSLDVGRRGVERGRERARAGVQARSHARLVNDARNGRLLYFGGSSAQGLQRELWIFDAGGWRRWQP